jgi:hypothetical protein
LLAVHQPLINGMHRNSLISVCTALIFCLLPQDTVLLVPATTLTATLCCCPSCLVCGLQVEALAASKAELKSQVRNLLSSQTDLLTRVSTLTAKWQQAVAENAALHRQNLQMAARQGA